uniref:UPF0462 protein C4orf33 homolog n=1 Tax=Angiostrongylus cantonensis TaxID=6313 RepID=A0A0K0DK95_ANGCA
MSDEFSSLSGFDYMIDKTWDGLPVDHDPIHVRMKWHFAKQRGKPHKRVIKINFEAPLFDDPEAPPDPPGILPGLWEYEVVEFFFANNRDQYIEVEVGPHGHWLCMLFDGIRKPFNSGEDLELEITNKFVGNVWNCELEIPLAYLPGSKYYITKFNSFAIHGTGNERVYEAFSPVTDGNYEEPDFHRLQFYEKINMRRLLPDGYGTKPFIDYKYGDIWKDHY